jgi:hypothetical protein
MIGRGGGGRTHDLSCFFPRLLESLDSNQGVGTRYWNYSRWPTSKIGECLDANQAVVSHSDSNRAVG